MKHRKKPCRKKAALPKAYNVNDRVSIDLKVMSNDLYILYMVDEFSRYIKGVVIRDKKAETIVDALWEHWVISGPGTPSSGFWADNGAEFVNIHLISLCNQLGIHLMTTASYSPWQNGLCEKRHGLVDVVVSKLKLENPSWSLQKLVNHACFVRNNELNRSGFTASQIVFGAG